MCTVFKQRLFIQFPKTKEKDREDKGHVLVSQYQRMISLIMLSRVNLSMAHMTIHLQLYNTIKLLINILILFMFLNQNSRRHCFLAGNDSF